MVIMKKSVSSILKDGILQTEVFSFTKNASYQLTLKSQVRPTGRAKCCLIDDFLANGEAAFGGIRLLEKAGATVAGRGRGDRQERSSRVIGKLREARAIRWRCSRRSAAWRKT